MSPISAKLMPAPAAGPLTAVTIGQCRLRSRRRNGWKAVSSAAPALLLPGFWLLRPCKLAPVQNARPAPVITRQRTSAFLSSMASSASARPPSISIDTAFMTSGWSSLRMATGPSKSSVMCLNCIGFLVRCGPRYLVPRYRGFDLIFDFPGRLVHGWWRTSARHRPRGTACAKPMETLMSMFDLTGRVAVVTGGNGGIGLGIAQALASSGCNVSIWGRNAEKNKAAAASLFGTARNEHYAATKAAINALCRALAVELARYGVTANAILPGWIKSDMTAGIMANEKFVANVMPRIPMRRFGEPGDFGGIAVYLMSKASSYHSADCFVIDGGYTAF